MSKDEKKVIGNDTFPIFQLIHHVIDEEKTNTRWLAVDAVTSEAVWIWIFISNFDVYLVNFLSVDIVGPIVIAFGCRDRSAGSSCDSIACY